MELKLKKMGLLLILVFTFWSCGGVVSPEIVVYGDSRTQNDKHAEIIEAIIKTKPAAVFHTGDLVANGLDYREWDVFEFVTADLQRAVKFYPALGNHEENSRLYFDHFRLPHNERWYSVSMKKIHFVVLDTNSGIPEDSPQYRWLENDLKRTDDKGKFKIVVMHHPPYSSGPHRGDEKGLGQAIVPLFETYGVDVVFCGHEHAYERLRRNNIYYIVTGGGGAPLYDKVKDNPHSQLYLKAYHFCCLQARKGTLRVEVLDKHLNKIDEFEVTPGPKAVE
jgi:3',5'-cyclic AMP phosphodiesterase CpdA